MKKIVVKFSKLSPELKKIVRDKLENEDIKFFSFPYQGTLEEGFLLEQEEVNYLVIIDNMKKSTYTPNDDDEDDDEDMDGDFGAVDSKDIDVEDDDSSDDDDDSYDDSDEEDFDDDDDEK